MTKNSKQSPIQLKNAFNEGSIPLPEHFAQIIDEASEVSSLLGGEHAMPAGLVLDNEQRLSLSAAPGGGVIATTESVQLSLQAEGGLAFNEAGQLVVQNERQIRYEDFWLLPRAERMQIATLLGLNIVLKTIINVPEGGVNSFGKTFSLSGDGKWLAVSAAVSVNQLFVYQRVGQVWHSEPQVLTIPTGANVSRNALISLNRDGTWLALGVNNRVYVYHREGGSWGNAVLVKNETTNGICMDAEGNWLAVVGDSNVYLHNRSDAIWNPNPQMLNEPSTSLDMNESTSLSGDGHWFACGAFNVKGIMVYYRNGDTWVTSPEEIKPQGEAYWQGVSLNANGSWLAISNTKGVYLYQRIGGAWSQVPQRIETPAHAPTRFAYSISLNASGNRLAVGTKDSNDNKVYLYSRVGEFWDPHPLIINRPAGRNDAGFGRSVRFSADGQQLAVACEDAASGNAVYVFGVYY